MIQIVCPKILLATKVNGRIFFDYNFSVFATDENVVAYFSFQHIDSLIELIDKVDLDELEIRSRIEDEIARFNKFRSKVLGHKQEKLLSMWMSECHRYP